MLSAVSLLVRVTSAVRPRRRAAGRAERLEQDVVLGRPPQRDPDPLGEDPDDEPGRLEPLAERLVRAQPDEVAVRLRAVVAGGDERRAHALALGDGRLDVEARLPQRGRRDPRRGRRDARRRPAPLELGGGLRRRDRVADAQRGEAERLRERPQHDQVRQLGDERHAGDAGELPVRLVDDDRRLRVCARESGDLGGVAQLAGRVVRVADPDQVGAVRLGHDLGALELRRDPVEAVRRREDRRAPAGGEEGRSRRLRSARRRRRRRRSAPASTPQYDAAASRSSRNVPSGYSFSRAKLAASGTCGTPGSGGVFWSKRSTCSGRSPCRAATSAEEGAHCVGPEVLRQRDRASSRLQRRGVPRQALDAGQRQARSPAPARARWRTRTERASGSSRGRARPRPSRARSSAGRASRPRRSRRRPQRCARRPCRRCGPAPPRPRRPRARAPGARARTRRSARVPRRGSRRARRARSPRRRRAPRRPSASASSSASRIASLSGPCSAWASRSAAH